MPIEKRGFTIVELLIVVVVIAILAAITAVVYQGIQNRAQDSVLQSDLTNAAKRLSLDKASNGVFPGTHGAAAGGNGLDASTGTEYEYTVDNPSNPQTYCLSAKRGLRAYHVTNSGSPQSGVCSGHTDPGAPPVILCSSLSVGNTGPGGGVIFHKVGNTCYEAAPGGWYAATAPNDPAAEWGCYGVDIAGAGAVGLGAGRQNTADILAAGCLPQTGTNLVAATIASNYAGGGLTDWHLPSPIETDRMYDQRAIIANLSGPFVMYWTSQEMTNNTASRRYLMQPGSQHAAKSSAGTLVRPIRSFSD